MSFTHQDTAITQATSSVTSVACTLNNAVTAGDLLVSVISVPDSSTTISDTASNIWTLIAPVVNGHQIGYCLSAKASTNLTVTQSGTTAAARFIVVDRFTPQGQVAVNSYVSNTIGTSVTSGTAGTINGDTGGNLLYAAGHTTTANATFSAGSTLGVSATIGSQVGNASGSGFSEYILGTVAGVEAPTWTSNVAVTGGETFAATFQDLYSPQLASGGNRTFTLADVVAALQQDVENATQTQAITEALTILVAVTDQGDATEGQITLTTQSNAPVWGSFVWGEFVWN